MNTVADHRMAVGAFETRRWLLALPALLYALTVFPFLFRDVLGEPDLERMTLGVIYGAASGLREAAGYHYNYLVSFGYYASLYRLLPRDVLTNSAALIAAINYIGFVSAVIAVGMLGQYLSRLYGVLAAFIACIVFAFSPVYLDLGTSGHPQLPGFALLLSGAWLLTFATDTRIGRLLRAGSAIGALAAFVYAMSLRADVALAFPFITLAGRAVESASGRDWLRAAVLRLVVMALACVLWLAAEMSGYRDTEATQSGGFVASFFATFYKLHTVPRGLIVFVLCMGVATVLGFFVLCFTRAARGLNRAQVVALTLLALPTLLFWLPNSTPGRHMLLAYLAVAIMIALLLSRSLRAVQAIMIAALLPIADQVIAEVTHGPIERHYQWAYPLLTSRRATTSIPMGAFPMDHEAKQQSFELLRNEGRAFARACSGQVLVVSEEPFFMMMSLIERDPGVRLSTSQVGDFRVYRAAGSRCTADFIEKEANAHRDPLPDFLQSPRYAGWSVYFQEARRNESDRTAVPVERRLCIDAAARTGCPHNKAPDTTAGGPSS